MNIKICVITFIFCFIGWIILFTPFLLIQSYKRNKVAKQIEDEILYQGDSEYLKTSGYLFITKDKLIFKALPTKNQDCNIEILINDISKIEKSNNWKIIEIVHNEQTDNFYVNAFDRSEVVKILNDTKKMKEWQAWRKKKSL